MNRIELKNGIANNQKVVDGAKTKIRTAQRVIELQYSTITSAKAEIEFIQEKLNKLTTALIVELEAENDYFTAMWHDHGEDAEDFAACQLAIEKNKKEILSLTK
jgi:hypothetical protein